MSDLGGLDEKEQGVKEGVITDFETAKKKRRPFHYWTVNGRDYKLKLSTGMIEKLENKYRTNIMNIVTDSGLPPLSIMLTVVQAAMSPWEHGIDYSDVKKMYDSWSEEGGNQMEFFSKVLMPTMAVSGFFTDRQAGSILESMKEIDELL